MPKYKAKPKRCRYQTEVSKHYHINGTVFDPGVPLMSKDTEHVEIIINKRRDFLREHGYFPVRDFENWKLLPGELTTEGLLQIPIKYCPRCRVIKPRTEFRANKARLCGIESYCKECHRVRCRQYRYDQYERYAPVVTAQWRYIKSLVAKSKRLLKNLVK